MSTARSARFRPGDIALAVLGAGSIGLWWSALAAFGGRDRSTDTPFLWDGSVGAIVFGMAILGGLAAFLVGGMLGLPGRWRLLGAVGLVPFAALLAVFSLVSGAGAACVGDGVTCEVSTVVRFGGLIVTLGCCAFAAFAARIVARGALR